MKRPIGLLGVCSLFLLSACVDNGEVKMKQENPGKRCDHAQVETFTVKISAAKDKRKKPKVDKETIHACFEDDIVFEGNIDEFTISFKDDSPFDEDLKASRGKAKGKVKAKPRGKPVTYKYDVIIPGYPVLDPRIIIYTR